MLSTRKLKLPLATPPMSVFENRNSVMLDAADTRREGRRARPDELSAVPAEERGADDRAAVHPVLVALTAGRLVLVGVDEDGNGMVRHDRARRLDLNRDDVVGQLPHGDVDDVRAGLPVAVRIGVTLVGRARCDEERQKCGSQAREQHNALHVPSPPDSCGCAPATGAFRAPTQARSPHPVKRPSGLERRTMTKPLWAPWRLEYIKQADELEGCVFCLAAAGPDEEMLVVHRGETAFVLLNKFPYSSGHLMVATYRHSASSARSPTTRRSRRTASPGRGWQRSTRPTRRRATTPAGTSAGSPAPASSTTSTCTSCPAGRATRTSCRSSPT